MSEVDNSPEQRIAQLTAIGELPLDERVSRLVEAEAALRDELGRSTADDSATS
ncbi:MAG: hypothetical protein ACO2Z1_03815 [Pontimonas sp.]